MKRLFGGVLLTVGILIAGASGLCSLAVFVGGSNGNTLSALPMILTVGGIPFAVGLAIAYAGRSLIREARTEDADRPGED